VSLVDPAGPLAGVRGGVRWSDESFTFESVPAGKYRLSLRAGADLREPSWKYDSECFELRGGETVDLGVIRSARKGEEPAGSIVLEVEPAGIAGLSAVVRGGDLATVGFLEEEGGVRTARGLAPGNYYVAASAWPAAGLAEACEPVEVRAGETARVRIRLESGVARTLSFPCADPAATWKDLRVKVKHADGRALAVEKLPRPLDDSRAVLVHVPVGSFTVEAESDTGLSARGTFSVPALTEQDSPLVFELR